MRKLTLEEWQKRINSVTDEKLIIKRRSKNKQGYFLIETKYGDVEASIKNILKGHLPTIDVAIDKANYMKSVLVENNPNICFSDFVYEGQNTIVNGECKVHGNNDRMPYEYSVVFEEAFDEAEWIEKKFHKDNKQSRYFPNKKFNGNWECYKDNPIEKLMSHIAKILEDKNGKQKETRAVS